MTSPPLVVNGVVITGSSVADNTRPDLPSGEVRAYDARTGALQMDVGSDPAGSGRSRVRASGAARWRTRTGAANAWSVLAADPERDLVFVPTGSAAPGLLRRAAARRQPLRQLDRRAERLHRRAWCGRSRPSTTISGTTTTRRRRRSSR